MAELLLVRHGETDWSRSGQHTSWTELPLTERGAEQARALRPLLAARTLARVLVSPRSRARDTARLAGLLDRAETEPDLREWGYGEYEGRTTPDILRARPGWSLWTDGAPGNSPEHPGESPREIGARVDRVLARLAPLLDADSAAGPTGDVLLVAHAHVLRVFAARRLGLPVASGALFRLETATVSSIGTEHGRPTITGWNIPTT
ncbi:histidine phosphatase family protein [Streptomyces sp. NPDC057702]|uniref:histidine phosphatase family protein n=1 Tax=unclassified Streptomyces TaxID=2593676 RepID=UPI00369B705A